MRERLRVFTDTGLIPAGVPHCQLLIPYLGNPHGHNGYDRLTAEGRDWLELATADQAEIALLPFDGRYLIEPKFGVQEAALEAARCLVRRAQSAGLKTLVLVNSDTNTPVPLDDVVVLRTSLERRARKPSEFALPAWHEDLLATYFDGTLNLRSKGLRPQVGFCGLAASSAPKISRRIKDTFQAAQRMLGWHVSYTDGVFLRQAAMEVLQRSPRVETQFVVRPACFHGVANKATRSTQRTEYLSNILDTDYTLCVRGYGNFSFRFFEAMSLGRIPLLIDTECVLPFDFLQDYREFCVIVPQSDISRAAEYVDQHYASLSNDQFQNLQRRIRAFWAEWIAPESFFRHVDHHWHEQPVPTPSTTSI